ncbi:MAG: flagellar hook-basal body complex protein FliE [Hyphomicrobium sp.]
MTIGLSPLGLLPTRPAVTESLSASVEQPSGATGSDFGQVVADMLKQAVSTIGQGEAVSMSGLQGKASVQNVVEAIMQTEQTLHTMVAIRDKVVGAYLEISRMQI